MALPLNSDAALDTGPWYREDGDTEELAAIDNMRQLVALGSGLANTLVLSANEIFPSQEAPKEPYATVKPMPIDPSLGTPSTRYVDGRRPDDFMEANAFFTMTVLYSVQFFKKGAMDRALRFAFWSMTPLGLGEYLRRGTTLGEISSVENVSDVALGTGESIEERAHVTITLSEEYELKDAVPYIETVEVSLSLDP